MSDEFDDLISDDEEDLEQNCQEINVVSDIDSYEGVDVIPAQDTVKTENVESNAGIYGSGSDSINHRIKEPLLIDVEVPYEPVSESKEIPLEVPEYDDVSTYFDNSVENYRDAVVLSDDYGASQVSLSAVEMDIHQEDAVLDSSEIVIDPVGRNSMESEHIPENISTISENNPLVEEIEPASTQARMLAYMSEHNYGPQDRSTYAYDPEYIALNSELLMAIGTESPTELHPIKEAHEVVSADDDVELYFDGAVDDFDSGSTTGHCSEMIESVSDREEIAPASVQERMLAYMSEHNYGPEDRTTYAYDPEYLALNSELQSEIGVVPTPEVDPINGSHEVVPDNDDVEAYFEGSFDDQHTEMSSGQHSGTIETGSSEDVIPPVSVQEQMYIYMSEHNYGPDDRDIYASDPKFIAIERDLKAEFGMAEQSNVQPMEVLGGTNVASESLMDDPTDEIAAMTLESGTETSNDIFESGDVKSLDPAVIVEAPEVTSENFNCFEDHMRATEILSDFKNERWETMELDEQKARVADLYDYLSTTLKLEKPPQLEFYNNASAGDYAYVTGDGSTVGINQHNLWNAEEAADSVAHELWHAYQQQRGMNPVTALDHQYAEGFDNYISYEDDPMSYEDQMVESDARVFAQRFKDYIKSL